jgi:uracil-DNA glycosylase
MTGLLSDPASLAARLARLRTNPAMRPLRRLALQIRRGTGHAVPQADPCDGGAAARILLLLETPGPGIRIVSRDNAGGTAANLRRFLAASGIARQDLLIWNLIPWMIHAAGARNRAPRMAEAKAGLAFLPPLLDILPGLRVAILAGRFAARAEPTLRALGNGLAILAMPHPSPNCVCTSPAIGQRIAAVLAEAARSLHVPTATRAA